MLLRSVPLLALSFALEVSPVAVSHLGCRQSSLCWIALIATVWLGLCSSQLTLHDVSLLLGSPTTYFEVCLEAPLTTVY